MQSSNWKYCHLIPIREVLKEIVDVVFELEPEITYHSHAKAFNDTEIGSMKYTISQSTVYEDNEACLKVARMPKLAPRTKHIGVLSFAVPNNSHLIVEDQEPGLRLSGCPVAAVTCIDKAVC